MAQLLEDIKLDFKDVLIMPKRSELSSRLEVNIERTFKFKYGTTVNFTGVPLVVANMDHTGTFEMADALKQYGACVALHKFYTCDQLIQYFSRPDRNPFTFYSMGITKQDTEKFEQVMTYCSPINNRPQFVCVDVANGYSRKFVKFVEDLRDRYQNKIVIMAGNVVTPDMTYDLIERGVDIVKVGIGPGCLTADARILMSDGTYKNIADVQPGDEIITMKGTPAKVKRSFTTGYRKVMKIRNAHFHSPLYLTPDHKCFIGDLSSVSADTLQARGYKRILSVPDRVGRSKFKWAEAESLHSAVATMPSKITFNTPCIFNIDISKYFKHAFFAEPYNKNITSSYDLGYMFGTFLGDGHAHLDDNYSGRVEWYFSNEEQDTISKVQAIVQKITGKLPDVRSQPGQNFSTVLLHSKQWATILSEFGVKNKKHLPKQYMCTNRDYLCGLYDGLIDSDGHIDANNERFTNTSKQLIELFQFISLVLFDGCANVNKPQMQSSNRVLAVNESYTTFIANTLEKRLIDNMQAIKLLEIGEVSDIEVPVYDLEIDDDTHSFIANNMIVHNSVCTTRRITGVGYPQLSAIMECADAAHGAGGLICGDGGIQHPGDLAKAFAGGADFVMCGGIFAGHSECAGELIGQELSDDHFDDKYQTFSDYTFGHEIKGWLRTHKQTKEKRLYKVRTDPIVKSIEHFDHKDPTPLSFFEPGVKMKFYGMSSQDAMDKHYGGKATYRAAEGKSVEVPYKGSVNNTMEELLGGVRSACTYVGARKLKDLSKCTTFVRVGRILNDKFGDQ